MTEPKDGVGWVYVDPTVAEHVPHLRELEVYMEHFMTNLTQPTHYKQIEALLRKDFNDTLRVEPQQNDYVITIAGTHDDDFLRR